MRAALLGGIFYLNGVCKSWLCTAQLGVTAQLTQGVGRGAILGAGLPPADQREAE